MNGTARLPELAERDARTASPEELSRAALRWHAVLAAALCALGVAALGALSTDLGPWYRGLRQPAWKPDDIWFGPAWTLIYSLIAVSGLKAWQDATPRSAREGLMVLYAFNAFLNVLWSLLFFRVQRPDWAFTEVSVMWLSIALMIWAVRRHSRVAAWLLVPYLLWVTFAGTLNFAVVQLNAPFGG